MRGEIGAKMATDDERRRVARVLRGGFDVVSDAYGRFWLNGTLFGVDITARSEEKIRDGLSRLADLIEPHRGSGGRTILCAHCESASWCGCEPGDEEGGCDFEPSVTEGEPPYNLYSLYESVLRRRPRDEYAIDDDEVEELVDALLDICNAPGHDIIQRPQPSCDRDALLALTVDLDARATELLKVNDLDQSRQRRSARQAHAMDLMAACGRIREALGVVG